MEITERERVTLSHYLPNAALIDAVEDNNVEAIALLVKLGIDVNCTATTKVNDRERPIHYAAYNRYIEALKALLEIGAKPELKNNDGLSAYELAREIDSYEVCEVLREYKESKCVSDQPVVNESNQ